MNHSDIKLRFGNRLKQLRKDKKLSQDQLAQKSGLTRSYISDVERGSRNISLENIYTLSIALDVTLAFLLDLSDSIEEAGTKNNKNE
ncbi:helix-turn-helix domain-containing protein [Metabacillus iocasae]|uniref:Transcriptional regulator with XRE-family HTH domain n=1 Tax=Priestia iocasae TaxID=2291674 RepID=A0ABS2QY84_9BACI|nr:helix-turn-helix transcriptional regulator [Metabacillus iocasae]MBM7703902.1 transcriptional regulator with XRE-family HTH domain [Metabacillus iocasae]